MDKQLKDRDEFLAEIHDRLQLAPCFYGPFQVVARVGAVAYRLRLPDNAKIHDVFHVGLLKKFVGTPPTELVQLPGIVRG